MGRYPPDSDDGEYIFRKSFKSRSGKVIYAAPGKVFRFKVKRK